MAREGLMDDSGYNGFEECPRYEDCCKDSYDKGREEAIDEFLKELYPCKYEYNDDCFLCAGLAICKVFIAERIADRLKEHRNDQRTTNKSD